MFGSGFFYLCKPMLMLFALIVKLCFFQIASSIIFMRYEVNYKLRDPETAYGLAWGRRYQKKLKLYLATRYLRCLYF